MTHQLTFSITPEFVCNPPPEPKPEPITETETDSTELDPDLHLPRDHEYFDFGYAEFAIGDTFILDNPTTDSMPTEFKITGFEGYRNEITDTDNVQVICQPADDPTEQESYFEYNTFCDAVYRAKFVMFTSPDYLVDEINSIINQRHQHAEAWKERNRKQHADHYVPNMEAYEEVIKAQFYYGYREPPTL